MTPPAASDSGYKKDHEEDNTEAEMSAGGKAASPQFRPDTVDKKGGDNLENTDTAEKNAPYEEPAERPVEAGVNTTQVINAGDNGPVENNISPEEPAERPVEAGVNTTQVVNAGDNGPVENNISPEEPAESRTAARNPEIPNNNPPVNSASSNENIWRERPSGAIRKKSNTKAPEPEVLPEKAGPKSKVSSSSTPWIVWIAYPYALLGLLALIISGYIEYLFFAGVFTNFYLPALLLAITFEGVKVGTIVIGRFYTITHSADVSATVKSLNYATRIFLICFSVTCSFAKIAEFMDLPNLGSELEKETNKTQGEYKNLIRMEDSVLLATMDTHWQNLREERLVTGRDSNYVGPNYKAKKDLYDEATTRREVRLKQLGFERDSIILAREKQLRADPKAKNQILVGLHTTISNAGINIPFSRFYSWFVLIVAVFTTIILEMIIMTVFNYVTIIKNQKPDKY